MGPRDFIVLHRLIDAIVSVHIKILPLHVCPYMVSDCNHYMHDIMGCLCIGLFMQRWFV